MRILIGLLFTLGSFSAAWGAVISSAVPFSNVGRPATDVVYKGAIQTPDELAQLRNKNIDISDLNPIESSDLWKNKLSAPPIVDQLPIDLSKPVSYIDKMTSRLGIYRFSVRQTDASGETRIFTIQLSKNSHDFLTRSALLRKLGYNIPAIVHASHLTLNFNGTFSKTTFLSDLKDNAVADASRWIPDLKDPENLNLQMQDVLVFSSNEGMYNLATGYIPSEVIQGRRLLNSLIIPYAITDSPGTLNALAWKTGRIVDNSLYLDFDGGEQFTTPKEDALWILKRMQKLTRQDFIDIAKETSLPKPVQDLLVEKLISRSNSVMDAFKMAGPRLAFNGQITEQPDLVGGILKRTSWPGYASLFASPNPPDSPLSTDEMVGFFKSKVTSTVLESLMGLFNDKVLKGTDVDKKVMEKQVAAAQQQWTNFLNTGQYKKIPFGLFAFPTFNANIYISRDIVIGEYLGTDNQIQLADSLEVSATAGLFVSAVGLPTEFQAAFKNGVNLSRTYTHLKPTMSVVSAIKEPFKNLWVSELMKTDGGMLDELASSKFRGLNDDDKQKRLTAILTTFNNNLQKGESFIITNSLSGTSQFVGSLTLEDILKIQPNFFAQRFVLSRLHILKADDNTLHVYKDLGDGTAVGMGLALNAYIPILSFSVQKTTGKATTDFYKLNIKGDLKENPDALTNLMAIRQVLTDSSLELLRANTKPVTIQHQFSTATLDANLLWWQTTSLKATDQIDITQKGVGARHFVTAARGSRYGNDYQGFAIDTINSIISQQWSTDVSIPNPGSGDPGDTFKGQSFTRNAVFEIEKEANKATNPFLDLHYRWKGWKANVQKMQGIIGEVNQKFGKDIFSKLNLYGTSEFQLYSVDADVYIYQSAIDTLLHSDSAKVKQILMADGLFPLSFYTNKPPYQSSNRGEIQKQQVVAGILNARAKAVNDFAAGRVKEGTESTVNFISALEALLPFPSFIKLIGSWNGVYVQGRIAGYRTQQENGDIPIVSDSLGRVGSADTRGGLYNLQQDLGISGTEFLGYWIMRNL